MTRPEARAGADALHGALVSVFPWARHLSGDEVHAFVSELSEAVAGDSGRGGHADVRGVIVGWRATARILADPDLTAQLMRSYPDEEHADVTAP